MKKTRILVIALAVLMAFAAVSCEKEPVHEHSFTKEVVEDRYLATAATEDAAATYYKSCECGEKGEETFSYGKPLDHTHKLAEEWTSDGTGHWHVCSGCEEKVDFAEHTFGEWKTSTEEGKVERKCSVCGEVETAEGVGVSTAEELWNKIQSGEKVFLLKDISVNGRVELSQDTYVNLNGCKLSFDSPVIMEKSTDSYEVYLINGNVEFAAATASHGSNSFELYEKTLLHIENVVYSSNIGGIFIGNNNDAINVELVNSKLKIEGYYGIGTNATIPNPSKDIKIVIKNSSIETFGTENGDNTAVLFNVQGSVKITDGSTITGDRQAVILRGGEGHIIKDSTLKTSGKYDKEGEYTNGKWGSGNEVPLAALVVGNRSTSAYDYKTSVELENVIIDAPEKNAATNAKDYYAIYVWQNNTTNTVSVTGTVKFAETNNKVNTDKMNDATYTVKVIE